MNRWNVLDYLIDTYMFSGIVAEDAEVAAVFEGIERDELVEGWLEFTLLIGRWEHNKGERGMSKYHAKQVYINANGALKQPDENMPQDAIIFDSKLEAEYYRDMLLPLMESGDVHVEVQPQFEILRGSTDEWYKFSPVHYTPDFLLTYKDGRREAIDVKGMPPTADFVLRRKMFHHRYPLIPLVVLKYVRKYGGWVTLEQYAKAKRQARKMEKDATKK